MLCDGWRAAGSRIPGHRSARPGTAQKASLAASASMRDRSCCPVGGEANTGRTRATSTAAIGRCGLPTIFTVGNLTTARVFVAAELVGRANAGAANASVVTVANTIQALFIARMATSLSGILKCDRCALLVEHLVPEARRGIRAAPSVGEGTAGSLRTDESGTRTRCSGFRAACLAALRIPEWTYGTRH